MRDPSGHRSSLHRHRVSRRAVLQAAGAGTLALAGLGGRTTTAQETRIAVYPAFGTRTAAPGTEISFRGISAGTLGTVLVEGSESGGHSGLLEPHTDGMGASFVPDAPFEPGETVTVRAALPLRSVGDGTHEFRVVRPAVTVAPPTSRETNAPEEAPHAYRSRPDLRPPVIDVTTPAAGVAEGYIFVAPRVPGGQSGPLVLDNAGEPVWFAPPEAGPSEANDFHVQEYRGQPVLTWWEGAAPVGYGFGHFVVANRAYERIAEVQVGRGYPGGDVHEFLITPHGTAFCLLYHPVHWDLSPAGGTKTGIVLDGVVQEIDIASGHLLFAWHSLDHIALEESAYPLPNEMTAPWDYVHFNSIDVSEEGSLLVSARHTHAIYNIDTASGEIAWRLNGTRSDFTMGPETGFAFQHDARFRPNDEISLFDNHEADQDAAPRASSRGMVLQLDMARMTASLAKAVIHPTEILSVSQGNMQQLDNGNAFIGWGSAPVFSEFTPDGVLCFNGRLPRGVMSYRAYRGEWSGRPAALPDVVIEEASDGPTLYVSWNGATGVAGWRVLAGETPESLGVVRSIQRTGFETAIAVRTGAPCLAVQAVDRAGMVLGQSAPVWRP